MRHNSKATIACLMLVITGLIVLVDYGGVRAKPVAYETQAASHIVADVATPFAPTAIPTPLAPTPVMPTPDDKGIPALPAQTFVGQVAQTQALTRTAIVTYVNTHAMLHALGTSTLPQAITRLIFTTNAGVDALLHGENPGFPDTIPLCYVEFVGTFTFAGPGNQTLTFKKGYYVFDLQTGNLVMEGGLS